MTENDFIINGITKFTPAEVRKTGCELSFVQVETMRMMQRYRLAVQRSVVLLLGGIASGEHKSQEHPLGIAVDSAFIEKEGPVDVGIVFRCALTAGAKGIGIYWNGSAYSVHMDLRKEYAFWSAFKKHRQEEWNYRALIVDPFTLT